MTKTKRQNNRKTIQPKTRQDKTNTTRQYKARQDKKVTRLDDHKTR